MDARGITAALRGKWAGRYGLARCPCHSDKTPSLKVTDDLRKDDGLDVVCFAGCDWRDVKAALVSQGLLQQFEPRRTIWTEPRFIPPQVSRADRVELPNKVWNVSGSLSDSVAERYLTETRGLDVSALKLDHALKFHEGFNAMVAKMTDPITGELVGVHRTYLTLDARQDDSRGSSKMMLGLWGVIKLSPDDDVTLGLGVCEGIETGLRILSEGWAPIWACANAGGVARLPVIDGIESITIFPDYDENGVGLREAGKCAERWHTAGREVLMAPGKETR